MAGKALASRRVRILASAWLAIMPAGGLLAQTAEPAPAAGGNAAPADDLRALAAPVALFVDPLLTLILQAATAPIDVVKGERFLRQLERDPNLEPAADLDSAVLGLLNYPRVIHDMSEYVDWTDAMGQAVSTRLPELQDTIQDIRWSAYTTGLLVGNDVQVVTVEDEVVRILPKDPDRLPLPRYSGAALLAALEPAEAEEAEPVETSAARGSAPADPGRAAAAAPPSAPPASAGADPAGPADVEPSEVPVDGGAVAGVEAPPATVPATVIAAGSAPLIDYGETGDSFWSSAATFAGGAALGGLLGYAIGDDWFDGDGDDDWDGPDWFDDDFDADEVADRLDERREDRRDFLEERRDDISATRDERREDRAQRQQDRQAAGGERQGERQAGRDERQGERQAGRAERQGERQAGRAERQGERQAGRGDRQERRASGRTEGGPAAAALGNRRGEGAGKREVKLPDRGSGGASVAAKAKSAAAGRKASIAGKQRPGGATATAVGANRSQAIREKARGAASRQGGDRQVLAAGARDRPQAALIQQRRDRPQAPALQQRQERPQPAAFSPGVRAQRAGGSGQRSMQRPDRGGGGLAVERGGRTRAHADRGRQSRGGGRRG